MPKSCHHSQAGLTARKPNSAAETPTTQPTPRLIQRLRKNSLNSGVYRTNPIAIIVAHTPV
ncbi:hypothetical protein EMIT0215P_150101 [Pseudomonas serboccidentalis]